MQTSRWEYLCHLSSSSPTSSKQLQSSLALLLDLQPWELEGALAGLPLSPYLQQQQRQRQRDKEVPPVPAQPGQNATASTGTTRQTVEATTQSRCKGYAA